MGATIGWTWGSRRLWIDETLNEMLALSERHVAARGSHHLFVWRREDGALALRQALRPGPGRAWFDEPRGRLCLQVGEGRVREIALASGAAAERDASPADPPWPRVTRARTGDALSIQWPDGHVLEFSYPGRPVYTAACAPEVGLVAVPHGLRAVDVLDGRSGALVRTFHGPWMPALAPDGRTIALGPLVGRRIVLGDVATGAIEEPDEPPGDIDALRFSPDGTRLLVVACGRGWLVDPLTGRPIVRLERCMSPRILGEAIDDRGVFTAGGEFVVGTAGHQIVRWNAHTGALDRRVARGERVKIEAFAVDARGERAALVEMLYPGGLMLVPGEEAIVWDLDRDVEVGRVALGQMIEETLELSADGRRLAVGSGSVRVVELPDESGGPVGGVVEVGGWVGFEADALRPCRDPDRGFFVQVVRGGRLAGEVAVPPALSFAPAADGQSFAVGLPDGRVELRGLDGRVLEAFEAPAEALALALSPDGRLLVTGGRDGAVRCFARAAGG